MKEKTEDELEFGEGVWIYCSQHVRPHLTGWCTVGIDSKVYLGKTYLSKPIDEESANLKCKRLGLDVK